MLENLTIQYYITHTTTCDVVIPTTRLIDNNHSSINSDDYK